MCPCSQPPEAPLDDAERRKEADELMEQVMFPRRFLGSSVPGDLRRACIARSFSRSAVRSARRSAW